MTAYDEIDLVCPKCHGLELKEVSRYIGTTDVRVFIDKMTGERHIDYPYGETDIDWDSGEHLTEDEAIQCQNCLWQGDEQDLVVAPDEPEPDDSWLVWRDPHMDGSHTVSVKKYPDGRPGTVTTTVPAGYEIRPIPGWWKP